MSQSIGSQFFAIHELLLLVLSYLSPAGKGTISSIDSNSLANLARVSRSISDVALDALWRSIHQPDAIVRLLPADACEVVETWDDDNDCKVQEYKLRRPLTANDFVAFDEYAPRIRFVDFSNSSRILGRGCELFPYIKAFRNPILPELTDFRWEPSVVNGSIGAFHLLSRDASVPREEFSMLLWSEIEHIPGESDVIASTIDAFNDPALPWLPDVKKLTLRIIHFLPAVKAAIQRLKNLEYFSCDLRLDPAVFESLAALPHLRFIDLRWLPTDATTTVAADSQSFRALEGLRISGTLSSIYALLPVISSPDLLSVRLTTKDFQSRSIEPALFSLLLPPAVPARAATLQHFTFTGPSKVTARSPGVGRVVLTAFAPLHACRALQTFRIDIDATHLVFTDNDVQAMARAWPALTVLTIAPPRRDSLRPPPDVHLYALWALAVGCPRLRQLALEVNAEVAQPFRPEDGADAPSGARPPMEELTLHCSPCGDPALVAGFLEVAFPRLSARAFHAYPTKGRPEDKDKWAAVTAALGGSDHVDVW
ncbi:hypothetical protein DFH07DRAFT_1057213 [Mycena maculata]|uniref:F-box domain-containing protein n=1 Tax=Mycena maculata TaxID=230809 RepID=A0AAD7NT20_9AGAR|nr:hypothetical protein DFH07DRAFT_1057213 [Mycena maculata]